MAPEDTAARVALWRALHLRADATPPVFTDEIGVQLLDPEDDRWQRPDMDPNLTRPMRAGIVARARAIEDLLVEHLALGVDQYVILGAGLDTFAQRRPDLAATLTIYEVDRPGPQEWKRRRLDELEFDAAPRARSVPVDFEHDSWWDRLVAAGFDPERPAFVASAGVTMYLTEDANTATLRRLATLAPGSALVTTFMLPLELVGPDEQRLRRFAEDGARTTGTPFITFYTPETIVAAAEAAGFPTARHLSARELTARYFADRTDGLEPAESEQILVAST
ncbi:class I SAM-dependent methyltransferase [Nocardia bovistercoris]|uniref:class I SAM-dependent methyltransferase n=1 Tax=Nocardia bovistercoris TaxID=2785916 RepID=UPI0038CD69A4